MSAIQISDELHFRISKKRLEIYEKYGIRVDMRDIAEVAIEEVLSVDGRIEELLELKEIRKGVI